MSFAMIVFVYFSRGGVAVTSVPFESMALCEAAKETVVAQFPKSMWIDSPKMICVQTKER